MPNEEIEELKNCFIKALNPLKIYLFGSFANGTATKDSDFNFYIVVNNEVDDLWEARHNARRSVREVKKRPLDIIVGTEEKYNRRKDTIFNIEKEVNDKGILIYDSTNK